jgi:hypothetical protein
MADHSQFTDELTRKVVPQPSMETYRGRSCIAPLFLNLALDAGEWSASCPGHFMLREKAPGTLCEKMSGPQRKARCFTEEKSLLPILGIKPQIRSPIA